MRSRDKWAISIGLAAAIGFWPLVFAQTPYPYAPASLIIARASDGVAIAGAALDALAITCDRDPRPGIAQPVVIAGQTMIVAWDDRDHVGRQCQTGDVGAVLLNMAPACTTAPCPIYTLAIADSGGTSPQLVQVTRQASSGGSGTGGGTPPPPPPPPPPPTDSPDGTRLPPAPAIVAGGCTWTLAGQQTMRDCGSGPVWAGAGMGDRYAWCGGTLFVLGTDGAWYSWGGSWTRQGLTDPCTAATPPPDPCAADPITGKRPVRLLVGDWTRIAQPKGSARVLFSLTQSRDPVVKVTVKLNGVDQPNPATGTNLNATAGMYFTAPATEGTYSVAMSAVTAAGCEDGVARPMSMVVVK